MADVLTTVELVADGSTAIPVAPHTERFVAAHAADDGRLVSAARDGDRGAFASLYERYARVVHGLLLARVGPEHAEDLVQDVFLMAWRRLDDLRDPAAFGGWLVTITRNRAMDFHRRPTDFVELPEDVPVADDPSQRAEARAALDAIRGLREAYRETLVLRLVEGLSGPEIASRTGLTPASVRVNLHRGMKLLREKLRR